MLLITILYKFNESETEVKRQLIIDSLKRNLAVAKRPLSTA